MLAHLVSVCCRHPVAFCAAIYQTKTIGASALCKVHSHLTSHIVFGKLIFSYSCNCVIVYLWGIAVNMFVCHVFGRPLQLFELRICFPYVCFMFFFLCGQNFICPKNLKYTNFLTHMSNFKMNMSSFLIERTFFICLLK